MTRKKIKIAIIGGGAAGMMAAISAARVIPGSQIAILEKNEQLGKKILATGNGRCNFSNRNCIHEDYVGEDTGIVKKVLDLMSPRDTIELFEKFGVLAREESQGRFYPYSEQALSVRDALAAELEYQNINLLLNSSIAKAEKTDDGFLLTAADGDRIEAKALIIATGGKAGSQFGSTGDGYGIAKGFGHTLVRPLPALVQIISPDNDLKGLKGVRAKGTVSLYVNNKFVAEERGEIQFTDKGLSGICVFDLTRYMREDCGYEINIDLYPDFTWTELFDKLAVRKEYLKDRTVEAFLDGMMNKKLIPVYLKRWNVNNNSKLSGVTYDELKSLCAVLKEWRIAVNGTKGWTDAQVTKGGVNTAEIYYDTLESRLINGLYFAGEVLDVAGRCGGWNLQWAWSSGYMAGFCAAKSIS